MREKKPKIKVIGNKWKPARQGADNYSRVIVYLDIEFSKQQELKLEEEEGLQ